MYARRRAPQMKRQQLEPGSLVLVSGEESCVLSAKQRRAFTHMDQIELDEAEGVDRCVVSLPGVGRLGDFLSEDGFPRLDRFRAHKERRAAAALLHFLGFNNAGLAAVASALVGDSMPISPLLPQPTPRSDYVEFLRSDERTLETLLRPGLMAIYLNTLRLQPFSHAPRTNVEAYVEQKLGAVRILWQSVVGHLAARRAASTATMLGGFGEYVETPIRDDLRVPVGAHAAAFPLRELLFIRRCEPDDAAVDAAIDRALSDLRAHLEEREVAPGAPSLIVQTMFGWVSVVTGGEEAPPRVLRAEALSEANATRAVRAYLSKQTGGRESECVFVWNSVVRDDGAGGLSMYLLN